MNEDEKNCRNCGADCPFAEDKVDGYCDDWVVASEELN